MPSFINNTEFDFIPINQFHGILLKHEKGQQIKATDLNGEMITSITNKEAIELLKLSEADSITKRNIAVWIYELEKGAK